MIDGRRTRLTAASAGAATGEHEELNLVPDAEKRGRWPLSRLDRQSKEFLIERIRTVSVSGEDGAVTPVAQRKQAL